MKEKRENNKFISKNIKKYRKFTSKNVHKWNKILSNWSSQLY